MIPRASLVSVQTIWKSILGSLDDFLNNFLELLRCNCITLNRHDRAAQKWSPKGLTLKRIRHIPGGSGQLALRQNVLHL